MLAAIILLIFVIILAKRNQDYQDDIHQLRHFLYEHNLLDEYNASQTKKEVIRVEKKEEKVPLVKLDYIETPSEPKMKQEESILPELSKEERQKQIQRKKNTFILAAGAFLIVLAAIVFLLTTWNTTPKVIKVGVMIVLIGLFIGLSVLSDKKYHLEQTSKTFYYIAMALIPIVLVALFAFKLVGNYFYKEAPLLYGTLCCLFLAILYGYESSKAKRTVLLVAGLSFQVLTLIFGMSHLFAILPKISDFFILISVFIVYQMLFSIVVASFSKTRYLKVYRLFGYTCFVITYFLMLVVLPGSIATSTCEASHILALILLIICYSRFNISKEFAFGFAFDLLIVLLVWTFLSLSCFTIVDSLKMLGVSITITALYAVRFLRQKSEVYKLITYFSFNLVLASICWLLKLDNLYRYIPFATTLLILVIENFQMEGATKAYLIVSFGIAFAFCCFEDTVTAFIMTVLLSFVFLLFMKERKAKRRV